MALNFPAKIYQILENESSDIIRWHGNGTAFRIVDHGRFEREIIPKYFRHNQISSVQRQLNLYGFKCVSRGEDKGAFYHPKFKRGDWEIVKKITRYAPVKKSPTEVNTIVVEKRNDSTSSSNIGLSNDQQQSLQMTAFNALAGAAVANEASFQNFQQNAFPTHFDRYGFPLIPSEHAFMANSAANQTPNTWQWMSQHPTQPAHQTTTHNLYHPPRYLQLKPELLPNFSHGYNAVIPNNLENHESVQAIPAVQSAELNNSQPAASKGLTKVDSSHSLAAEDKNFISVKNSVVTVDPYFDLDDEFDLFVSDNETNAAAEFNKRSEHKFEENRPISYGPLPSAKGPMYVDMGVNTDVTQASHAQQLDGSLIFR